MKVAPPAMVARIHFTVAERLPRAAAATPKTIVKLLASSTEKVSESDTMNSHIPSFFEPMAKGEAPPPHSEAADASSFESCTVHRPRYRSKSKKIHSPSIKCQ